MNRERLLLAASVLMLAGVAFYHLRPPGSIRSARPVAPSLPPGLPSAGGGDSTQSMAQAAPGQHAAAETLPWGRNPFLTEREAAEGRGWRPDETLRVKAIIVGQPRGVATLNDRTVVVGDKVGEETVREIRRDGVVLEKDGRKRVLRIAEPSIAIEVKEGRR